MITPSSPMLVVLLRGTQRKLPFWTKYFKHKSWERKETKKEDSKGTSSTSVPHKKKIHGGKEKSQNKQRLV